ncbi:chemotaxis response regulator protein-glutamate methylesterase [Paenibacillus sepulcri]|uniref:protein-glutamate methylesterase/protein-glutamine glutaminase n=1 Tax=Paenibacillus sepulcri TaxID=359917 RepID=UPI0035EA2236
MAIKVLVVDDSAFMRNMVSRYISEDNALEVIGTARNGLQAIELTKQLAPDVITLDIEMPVMNGLDALKRIMAEKPTPVLMLSSLTETGAAATIRALQYGAVDFIHKPSGALSFDLYKVKQDLSEKIKTAAQVSLRNLLKLKYSPLPKNQIPSSKRGLPPRHLIAIGASTGGPQALLTVLQGLSADFPHAIVIVQHMPSPFTASLAERLNHNCSLTVREAEHDARLEGGCVYIAPGDRHMNIAETGGVCRIKLHQRPSKGLHMPSVHELFTSVSALQGLKRHLVMLTGMGSDGAEALAEGKAAGAATTIAQSKESSVVFGMPRAAIETGAVDYIVDLEDIAAKLREVTGLPSLSLSRE